MAEGLSAGSAFITIKPDMSTFASDIKGKLAAQGDEAAKAFADSFQARLKAAFANLPNASIEASADTAKARAELDDAAKPRTARIKVDVDKSSLARLQNPLSGISPLLGGGLAGAVALGPQALGLGLGLAGIGAGFGAAAAGALSFGIVAKGMFSDVGDAQKKLTAATEAYNKATTDKARAKALADEKAALAGLSPAERQLATELTAVSSAWKSFQQAQQPAVGQAITPWLRTATDGMRLLGPLVTGAAGAIQFLGNEADAAIRSPFWSTFSNVLGTTGGEALIVFGSAVGKVGDGLAHLFVTFAPDIQNVLPLVDKAAGAFDNWAKSVTSTGLDNFFKTTFSPANVAALKTDLHDVATIVGNVAKAGAQLSPTAFSGLSNLLAVAAKLTPGQLEALGGLFLAGKSVGGLGNLAKLASGGAVLGLPGKGAGKAASAEKAAVSEATRTSKLKAFGSTGLGTAALLPAVDSTLAGISSGPGGKNWFDNPFGMAGPNDKASANNWLTSWAPYEKIFTTDLPKAWSISYEAFQVEFAGKITSWFSGSLPHFFTAGIPMGWSTAYEGFQRDFAGPLTSWFSGSLPRFLTSSIPANAWSPAYEGFQRDVAGPLTSWFSGSLPHFFTAGVPGAWSWAYQGFESNVGSPVASWFGSSVPRFFTSAVPSAWSWAYQGFTGNVGSPVASWFANSVPRFFTSSVPSAWSWAYTGFMNNAGSPVSKWFSSSLPSFVTRSIPGAFSSLWSSFSSNVIGPVENFFSSTLPNLAASAKGLLHNLGIPGFASGTAAAPPGWFWVGENGPELMRFAGGEQVKTHAASLAMAAQSQALGSLAALGVPSAAPRLPGVGSPAAAGPLELRVSWAGSGNQVTDAIVSGLQFHVQHVTGGDVQAALGQGPVR